MTNLNVPTDTLLRQSAEPITVSHGGATVTYLPRSVVEVGIAINGPVLVTGAGPARALYACLDEVFGPLAETQRVARRVAALADVPA